jgi:hypothetical protein
MARINAHKQRSEKMFHAMEHLFPKSLSACRERVDQ